MYGGGGRYDKLDAVVQPVHSHTYRQYNDNPLSSLPPIPPSPHGAAAAATDLTSTVQSQPQLGAISGTCAGGGPAGAAADSGESGTAPTPLHRVPTLRRPPPATSSPAHHSVRLMCFNYGVLLSSVPGLREALRTAQDAVQREEEAERAQQLAVGKMPSSWLDFAPNPADAAVSKHAARSYGWGLGLRLRRLTSSARGGQAGSPSSPGVRQGSGKRGAAEEEKEAERRDGGDGAEGVGSFSADGAVAVELGSMDGRGAERERDRTVQQQEQQQQPMATTHRRRDVGCCGITFDVLFRILMEQYAMVGGRGGGMGHVF